MRKLTLFVLIVSVLVSCKKDKDCNQDMAGISGTYKITAVKYKASAAATEQDYYNNFFTDACERDDRITLNSNGTYTFTDAGVKCTPPGDDSGIWSISGNSITIDGDTQTIQSFNCSTMVISIADNFVVGDQVKLTLTRQ